VLFFYGKQYINGNDIKCQKCEPYNETGCKHCRASIVHSDMGGDYSGGGTKERVPKKNFAWGDACVCVPSCVSVPPTIATFSKKIHFFSILTTILDYQYTVYSHTEILKGSCLYKLVNDVPVNQSDVALNFLLQPLLCG